MTGEDCWSFPLLALAISPSGSALVVFERPLRIGLRLSWRKWSTRHLERVLESCEPLTILVTHATRRDVRPLVTPQLRRALKTPNVSLHALSLNEACVSMQRDVTLPSIATRLVDMYPEHEERFHCFTTGRLRTKRARMRRPFLSALAVAHAASVRHVSRYG